jgi:hypothetical protein
MPTSGVLGTMRMSKTGHNKRLPVCFNLRTAERTASLIFKHDTFCSCIFLNRIQENSKTNKLITQLLPSELKHLIAALSSPNSLASLARTHTSFQREAEQALYRTLSIHTRNEDSLRCLETLATNSEKATLVRFLTVECGRFEPNVNQRSIPYLLKGLVNMHSLSDFRLRIRSNEVGLWIENLHKILWSVYEFSIISKLTITAGDIVKVIFNYTLFIATTIWTFLESSTVKPKCRYLEYTPITHVTS